MDHIDKTATRINEHLADYYSRPDTTPTDRAQYIKDQIKYVLDDVFKILKNINQTSLGEEDRNRRIHDLQTKYGIPITHLI